MMFPRTRIVIFGRSVESKRLKALNFYLLLRDYKAGKHSVSPSNSEHVVVGSHSSTEVRERLSKLLAAGARTHTHTHTHTYTHAHAHAHAHAHTHTHTQRSSKHSNALAVDVRGGSGRLGNELALECSSASKPRPLYKYPHRLWRQCTSTREHDASCKSTRVLSQTQLKY